MKNNFLYIRVKNEDCWKMLEQILDDVERAFRAKAYWANSGTKQSE